MTSGGAPGWLPVQRRTQAERRESTRQALFRATMASLLENGYAALRLSDITTRAGVSSGALMHHFGGKNELIVAAARHAFEEQLAKELAIVDTASRSDDPIGEMIDAQGVFFLSPLFMVHTELSAAARGEPSLGPLRDVVQTYNTGRDRAWLEMLVARGFDRTSTVLALEMTFHLWRGMGLRYFRDPTRLKDLEARSIVILGTWRVMIDSMLKKSD